jgi:hypothetical protein
MQQGAHSPARKHFLVLTAYCALQTVELIAQGVLTIFLFVSGHYVLALLHVAFDVYVGHLWMEKKLRVDATDAFKKLPAQKRQRMIQLAFYIVSFMFIIYKWVAAAWLNHSAPDQQQCGLWLEMWLLAGTVHSKCAASLARLCAAECAAARCCVCPRHSRAR